MKRGFAGFVWEIFFFFFFYQAFVVYNNFDS